MIKKLSPFDSKWFKSSVIVGIFSLLIFESVHFSNFDPGTKYKIYTVQFYFLFAYGLSFISKYFWKCLVTELFASSKSVLVLLWKAFLFTYFALVLCAQFTHLWGSVEPSVFQWTSWVFFGSFLDLCMFLPTARLMVWLVTRATSSKRVGYRKVTVACLIATVVSSTFSYYSAMEGPEIVKVNIPIKNLPSSFDGYKVALLTDVHIGPTVGLTSVERVVELTNEIDADIVAFVGDLIDTKVVHGLEKSSPLKNIRAKQGKYFVTGNHEYYTGEVNQWFKVLESYGFEILHNTNKIIKEKKSDSRMCLIGVDDIQANHISYGNHGMNLTKAYEGCHDNDLNILLAHQPNAAKSALDDNNFHINLVLSGHTHGGQMYSVALPMYLTNAFYRGLYKYKDSYVYVSDGTLYWGMPMRSGSKCEITEITLVST